MRRRVVVPTVVSVLVLVAAGLVGWRVLAPRTSYAQAISLLPASTLRASYTDWTRVRELARGTTLGPASTTGQVHAFGTRAYNRGLTDASALTGSVSAMERLFGFSPLEASWEVYGQSRQGAVDVLRLPDGMDYGAIEQDLRSLGYREPAGGLGTGGVWRGSANLLARIDPALTPVQQNLVVLAGQHLVLMSDSAEYVGQAAAVVRGQAASLASISGVADLTGMATDAGDPVSAMLWARDFACVDLGMGSASTDEQRVGNQLVSRAKRAGGINPLSGLVMALASDRTMTVGMVFEDSDQASENLQPRTNLASGPAPGQGGSFRGRFTIISAQAHGSDVEMRLQPKGDEQLLSDLDQGPVLFATC